MGTLVVSGFVLVGLIGNRAIDASNDAVAVAQWDRAETEARKATRWAPWSAEPWALIGEAQLGRNEFANARASFRKAIDRDPGNYLYWLDLSLASEGQEQIDALARAQELNPLDRDLGLLQDELGGILNLEELLAVGP